MTEIECRKCNEICYIDGEYPKFFAWCEECSSYADWDVEEYTIDWIASRIDEAKERLDDQK